MVARSETLLLVSMANDNFHDLHSLKPEKGKDPQIMFNLAVQMNLVLIFMTKTFPCLVFSPDSWQGALSISESSSAGSLRGTGRFANMLRVLVGDGCG